MKMETYFFARGEQVAAGEGAGAAPDRVLPVSEGCQRQGRLPVSQRGNAAGAQQGE